MTAPPAYDGRGGARRWATPPVRAALFLVLSGCVPVPITTGIDYDAAGQVVDGTDGRPVEGARVRLVGIRLGRPSPLSDVPYPGACGEYQSADSLVASAPGEHAVAVHTVAEDTTAADGRFAVAIERGRAFRFGFDTYAPREYDWRKLEVEREGYRPVRVVIAEACPGSLVPPKTVELTRVR